MKLSSTFKLLISIIVCEAAGIIGSIFTSPSIPTWYANIARPSFSPPNWVFGPVWTILFALMGIAFYMIWKKGFDKKEVRMAALVFGFQLVLNIFWSIIFFGLESPGLAFAEVIFLWIAILATIISFYRIDKTAGYILIPYILWVSFAAFLNYNIWVLN